MQISSKLFNEQQLRRFSNLTGEIQNIQDKIASGKKILKASDDPIGAINLSAVNDQKKLLGQFEKNVGVGMAAAHLPLYALEVSGSAVVGEPLSSPLATGFFINGDGQYKLLIGGHSISDELVMASPNISIKNGWLMIEQGIDPGMQIIRDNTTAKIDKLYQLKQTKQLLMMKQKISSNSIYYF